MKLRVEGTRIMCKGYVFADFKKPFRGKWILERVGAEMNRVPRDVYECTASWLTEIKPGISYSMWKQYCVHGVWKTVKPMGFSTIVWSEALEAMFYKKPTKGFLMKRTKIPLDYIKAGGFDCIVTDSAFIKEMYLESILVDVPEITEIVGTSPWVEFIRCVIRGQGSISVSSIPPNVFKYGSVPLEPLPEGTKGKTILVLSTTNVGWCRYMTRQFVEQDTDAVPVCIITASRNEANA